MMLIASPRSSYPRLQKYSSNSENFLSLYSLKTVNATRKAVMQGKVGWGASASVPPFEIAAAFPAALANPLAYYHGSAEQAPTGFGNLRVAACLCFQPFEDLPCHVTRKSVPALSNDATTAGYSCEKDSRVIHFQSESQPRARRIEGFCWQRV